jgi:hypothetical protein
MPRASNIDIAFGLAKPPIMESRINVLRGCAEWLAMRGDWCVAKKSGWSYQMGSYSSGLAEVADFLEGRVKMSHAEAVDIAVAHARQSDRVYTDTDNFVPHDWVVSAILEAANGPD